MLPRPHWKTTLKTTTALIGVAVLGLSAPLSAQAAPVVINGALGQVSLQNGDALTITPSGTITAAVAINSTLSAIAASIDNQGTIDASNLGILLGNLSISNGITNSGLLQTVNYGIIIASFVNGGISNSGTIDGGNYGMTIETGATLDSFYNTGVISGVNNAILVNSYSSITSGISNSGTIDGGAVGIYISSNSVVNGLTNSGIIISGNTGIGFRLSNHSTLTGGMLNSGTIEGGAVGIELNNSSLSGGLTNSGTVNGRTATGLSIANMVLSGSIVNSGIVMTANPQSSGFRIFASTITGGIFNSGTIAGQEAIDMSFSTLNNGLTNSGTILGAVGILLSDTSLLSGGLTNSGIIGGQDTGIIVRGASQVTGGLTNSGTITGGLNVGNGIALRGNSQIDNIVNLASGFIYGTTQAIEVSGSSEITGGLTNYGTIDGSGIFFGVNARAGSVINTGTLSILNVSGNAEIVNGITNSGTIGTVFFNTSQATNLTLSGDNARITGNVSDNNVSASPSSVIIDGDFTTEGNFTVTNLAVNAGETLTIAAGNTFSIYNDPVINGTLGFGIKNTGDHGLLTVSNGTIDFTSATLAATIENGATLNNGDLFLVADGVSTINGLNGKRITDNSTNWRFVLLTGDNGGGTDDSDLFLQVFSVQHYVVSTATNTILQLYDDETLTVTETGSIVAGTTPVYINNAVAGSISNDGTIDGGTYAISLTANGTLSGGLTNNGTITGPTAAISLGSSSTILGGVINSGLISSPSSAVVVRDASRIDTFKNLSGGVISAASGEAIRLQGSRITNGLTNHGVISANANAINIVDAATLSGGLTNSGTINSNNDAGVRVLGAALDTLLNDVSGTITGLAGILIATGSPVVGTIENRGLVHGDDTGLYFGSTGPQITGSVINSGTISGGQYGLYLLGDTTANIAGGITNSGLITGNVGIYTSRAPNSCGYSSGCFVPTAIAITGGITNSGTIQGTGGTALYMKGLYAASPLVLDGGRIIGDVTDPNPERGFTPVTVTNNFTTEGNFSVSSLAVNNGRTLTLDVGDTFTTYNDAAINGTLTFNVTDAANFGALVVSNGIANLTNATLTVGVIGSGLAAGDEIRVINGNTAIIGGPGATPTTVADNSYLWNFVAFDGTAASAPTNNTDLFIRAVQDQTATEAASTPNNEAAGQVLQDIALVTTDTTLQQVIANINNAPTQDTVNEILESVTPTVDTAIADATTAIAQQGADLIQTRLGDVRAGSGVSSGQLTDALGVWGQLFGQHASQSKRDNVAGYSANTYGFVGGIDTDQLFDNTTIGFAVSYGNSAIKSQDANDTRTDIDSYQMGVYGDYQLPQDYFVSGSLGYGYSDIASTRFDVGAIDGLNANADYKADQYTAHLEIGKDFMIKPAYAPTITPTLGATYTHLSPDAYTETGAGGASLTVETDSIESFELGAAIKSQWDIKQSDGALLSPSLHAGYRYDLIGDTIQATSNFTGGGASFNTQGANPAKGATNIGAGLKYKATSNWTFSASYDFETKEDYTAHAGILRAGYGF